MDTAWAEEAHGSSPKSTPQVSKGGEKHRTGGSV